VSVIIEYEYYPFIVRPEEIIKARWPGLSLGDILSVDESPVLDRSLEILRSIISKGFVPPSKYDSDTEILAFYSMVAVARLLNDKKLAGRIAVSYAKRAWRRLREEPYNVLVSIGRLLGLRVETPNNPPRIPMMIRGSTVRYRVHPLGLPLEEYLVSSERLSNDQKYALVNQIVWKGMVYVERDNYVRLLQEVIFKKIMKIYEDLSPQELGISPETLDRFKRVLKETGWFEKMRLAANMDEQTRGIVDTEAFPPCMKRLMDRLVAGENLSHHERFSIAAFLARIGMSVDDILELFKNAPDYNEKIARYQIEHIAGLRGARKKYLPYNCDTMKSYGLCPIQGYCEGGRNPLAVYKRRVWEKIRERRKNTKGT
jgi:DNA primase large subunit